MKVIGAGFGRTGTMSLKGALEQLGFGPSFHMIDLARQPELLPRMAGRRRRRAGRLEAAARGLGVDRRLARLHLLGADLGGLP